MATDARRVWECEHDWHYGLSDVRGRVRLGKSCDNCELSVDVSRSEFDALAAPEVRATAAKLLGCLSGGGSA